MSLFGEVLPEAFDVPLFSFCRGAGGDDAVSESPGLAGLENFRFAEVGGTGDELHALSEDEEAGGMGVVGWVVEHGGGDGAAALDAGQGAPFGGLTVALLIALIATGIEKTRLLKGADADGQSMVFPRFLRVGAEDDLKVNGSKDDFHVDEL